MSLSNLVVDESQISEDVLETILAGNVELIKEGEGVRLIGDAWKFSPKCQVMLYLAAKHAWKLIGAQREAPREVRANELAANLGIPINTVYGVTAQLVADGQVDSDGGKYAMKPRGLHALQEILPEEKERASKKTPGSTGRRRSKGTRAKGTSLSEQIKPNELSRAYVEEAQGILENSTNADKYLLAIWTAEKYFGLEGLTPAEVGYLLCEPPLRQPKLYVSNISRDLGKMRKLVVARKRGSSYQYGLTTGGIKRVTDMLTGPGSPEENQ